MSNPWRIFEIPNPPFLPVRATYIECGVQRGDSLDAAMHQKFKRIYGIEVCERNFQHCVQRFGGDGEYKCRFGCCNQKWSIHLGPSTELLPRICEMERENKTTILLDSHWSEGPDDEMYAPDGQCPLLKELQIIAATKWITKPLIVIDERRMFTGTLWKDARVNEKFRREDWPTLGDIVETVSRWDYTLALREDQIWLW